MPAFPSLSRVTVTGIGLVIFGATARYEGATGSSAGGDPAISVTAQTPAGTPPGTVRAMTSDGCGAAGTGTSATAPDIRWVSRTALTPDRFTPCSSTRSPIRAAGRPAGQRTASIRAVVGRVSAAACGPRPSVPRLSTGSGVRAARLESMRTARTSKAADSR